jgi:hypothetical protein
VDLGLIALIFTAALLGPALSLLSRGAVPVVVGGGPALVYAVVIVSSFRCGCSSGDRGGRPDRPGGARRDGVDHDRGHPCDDRDPARDHAAHAAHAALGSVIVMALALLVFLVGYRLSQLPQVGYIRKEASAGNGRSTYGSR